MPCAQRSWDSSSEVLPDAGANALAKATEDGPASWQRSRLQAMQASKRLIKAPFREQIKAAMRERFENEAFSVQVRSEDALRKAFSGLPGKRKPDFTKTAQIVGSDGMSMEKIP